MDVIDQPTLLVPLSSVMVKTFMLYYIYGPLPLYLFLYMFNPNVSLEFTKRACGTPITIFI